MNFISFVPKSDTSMETFEHFNEAMSEHYEVLYQKYAKGKITESHYEYLCDKLDVWKEKWTLARFS